MSHRPFTIHLVTQRTAHLLESVDDDVFDHAVTPDFVRELLSNPFHALFVAMVEGQVVGMATGIVHLHPDKPRSLFINEVGVAVRHLRRGIGTQLISSLFEWGRSQGCVEAWVATDVDNSAAQFFYESTGGIRGEEPAVVYVYSLSDVP